jgi:hypothetical protein
VFGDEVVFEYVVRGFLLFDLFLNQVLATTSADGRVESDLPGWASESNRPFNKPNTFRSRGRRKTFFRYLFKLWIDLEQQPSGFLFLSLA